MSARVTAAGLVMRSIAPTPSLVGVLLDLNAVVHLVHAHDLRGTAVAAKLVVLAVDERLHWFGRTHFRAEPTEAAAREVEVEVVENLDLVTRLPVAAQSDEIVGTSLRALVAYDARLRARGRFNLQPQYAAEARRHRTPFRRVLERECRLRRVLQGHPE